MAKKKSWLEQVMARTEREPRDARVVVMFTAPEKEALQAAAELAGMSVSSLIRELAQSQGVLDAS